mmetsp:Transcript_31276/g.52920  ORF Transcript_31276/g.52920 Transcript_31276/m.52920 type:complete len:208 (-) Transcript_31276:139-762(-)
MDLLLLDLVVEVRHEGRVDVVPVVDASVHVDELILGHLVLHAGIVEVRVQHDRRVREHVGPVRRAELAASVEGVVGGVLVGELHDQAVDLLPLPRKAKVLQKVPKGFVELHPREIQVLDVLIAHFFVKVLILPEVLPDLGFVEFLVRFEEFCDRLGVLLQDPVVLQELDPLLGLAVEKQYRLLGQGPPLPLQIELLRERRSVRGGGG